MLKWLWERRWRWWLWAPAVFVSTLLVLALASWAFGVPGEICTNGAGPGDHQCERYNLALAVLIQIVKTFDASSAFVTAAATALLVYVTRLLVNLGREQSETARAQLRAYVYGDVVQITGFDLITGKFEAYLKWINAGNTPARDFQTRGGIFFESIPLPDSAEIREHPDTIEEKHSKMAIFPNAFQISNTNNRAQEMPADFIAKARKKEATVYVYGGAIYWDVFGEKHTTEICKFVDPEGMILVLDFLEGKGGDLSSIKLIWAHRLNHFT